MKEIFESKLKEEIAAQSLILSALSGESIDTSQTVQISSSHHHQPTAADILIAAQGDHIVNTKHDNEEQYKQVQSHEGTENLSFDVSQAIGVEMIAIQQQQHQSQPQHQPVLETVLEAQTNHDEITITDNQEEKGNNGSAAELFNRQLVAGTLLETGLAGSPVVLNAIAIKGENGVTEIQFENGGEIEMEHTEVEVAPSQQQTPDVETCATAMIETHPTTPSVSTNPSKYIKKKLLLYFGIHSNQPDYLTRVFTNLYKRFYKIN